MPTINSGVTVWTFQDITEAVLDSHDVDRNGMNERRARAAVLQAYRDLPQRHTWSYYYRQRLLQTVAQYTTGTVAYTHTGGAYELMLTLTTGTWPAWAAFGHVVIDDVHYDVDDRKSNSVITLSSVSNPGANVAAGTAYTLYRAAYPLPADFGQMVQLWDIDGGFPIYGREEGRQHEAIQYIDSDPSDPRYYAIRGTGKYLGLREILFGPPPSTAKTYNLFYRAHPRPLEIDEYSSGTVTVTAAATTVTGTSTIFPLNCVGSIIRFSATGTRPSSLLGGIGGADNPFVFQDVIKTRTSDTSLELTSAAPRTIASGSGYTISDPLDIDANVLLTALLHAAEAEFSRRAGREDALTRAKLANQSLIRALENDAPLENRFGPLVYDTIGRAAAENSP